MFENRVLRTVFGPKRDEVIGEWRKLHKEELRDLGVCLCGFCNVWVCVWVGVCVGFVMCGCVYVWVL